MGRLMGSSNSNNYGEQIFINKASEYLDDTNIIYWNRQLFGKEFDVCILMPEKGILVVELKGWREENILRIENNDSVIIQTNDGEVSASPQKQARGYRFSIERHIRQNIGKFPLVYQNKKVCGNCYNYDYDGYVFVNELGERMRPNYLTEYFPKYIAKHGMPKMRFHDLRHSCASLLLANGVPLKQIQEWLGHSDFSTTANIYAHLDYRSKISSAQAMEQGMLLPRSDDFGSRWEDVTEQGKIAEPDLNPVFD